MEPAPFQQRHVPTALYGVCFFLDDVSDRIESRWIENNTGTGPRRRCSLFGQPGRVLVLSYAGGQIV